MAEERDERLIDAIPFALDTSDLMFRAQRAEAVRNALKRAGAKTAQDVIDLGCTGLVFALTTVDSDVAVREAIHVRANIAGAGFGLPCYVPPDKFCLVHNVVGGLQRQQVARHPEGLPLCSRELTDEERKHALSIDALAGKAAREEAKRFGKVLDDDADDGEPTPNPPANATPIFLLSSQFRCPEHKEMVVKCRFCLAAAVIAGPFEPDLVAFVVNDLEGERFVPVSDLDTALADGRRNREVALYVRAVRWQRKLVRED
jgi:hypothetical protein